MNSAKSLLITWVIILCAAPLQAGPSGAKNDRPVSLSLSLNEVLSLALINNFDVQLNMYDRLINRTGTGAARSIYDSVLTLSGEYDYSKLKQPSVILGKSTHTGTAQATLTKKLISGTDVTLDFENTRESSESAFVSMNPYYESLLEMKFTQPLLKNFFGMNDWAGVKITRIDVNSFDSEMLDKIEEALAGVEKAYWALATESGVVEARKEMLERAEKFYELNKKKREMGTSEAADLLAAEANKRLRELELKVEEDNLKTAMNALKFMINHPDTDMGIMPANAIEMPRKDFSFIDCLKTAFDNRRDYKRAQEDIKAKRIKLNIERNERWPKLDFEGSLKLNGLGPIYKDAAAKAFTNENPEYSAKLTFTLPLEDNAGRSEYDAAKYEKAKAILKLKMTEKAIVTDIDDNVRKVNICKDEAAQYAKIMDLEEKKLEEEEKQFSYGRSDSDRIIRFQEDILNARIRALSSLKDYKEALIDLYLAENVFLDKRGLTVR